MSDLMLHAVLVMPYDLWQDTPLDKAQRHARYVEASNRIKVQEKLIEQLEAKVKQLELDK